MADTTADSDAVPRITGAPDHAAESLRFAAFSADNEAAIHLLETVQHKSSPPTLISDEHTIGYHLSIPLSSDIDSSSSGRFTWRVGAGPSPALIEKGLCHCRPDILLCPPGRTPSSSAVRKFIKDTHAIINFHPHSGVLLLKTHSSRPIVYEKGDVDDDDLILDASAKRSTCVLRQERNHLRFGQYRFVVEFVAKYKDQDKFRERLDENLRCRYGGLRPSQLFNFIPTGHRETSWNVWLHQTIPNTSIMSGVNIYTGRPVAVKKLQIEAKTQQCMLDRLQIATQYNDRLGKGVLGIIDTWCGHNTSPPCHLDKASQGLDRCRHIFYSMPLAEYDFLNMPWVKVDPNTRLQYFYQTLLGLAALHEQDVVHGNILPESLLILGDTRCALSADDHSLPKKAVISLPMRRLEKCSASICVAPEVWKRRKSLDETKADIWALAASWLYAFVRPPNSTKITKESYRALQKTLDAQGEKGVMKETLVILLRQMLAWEPQDRPSAIEALANKAWESVLVEMQAVESNRKQKRMGKVQSSCNEAKRVRIFSPDIDD